MKNGYIALIISGILTLGIILSTLILGNSIKSIKEDTTIAVTGSAQKKITADSASWSGTFTASAPIQKDAYATIVLNKKTVLDFLKSQNVKESDISFSSIVTNTLYKRDYNNVSTNQVEGYELSQTVTIKSTDVNLVSTVSAKATDLIAQNVNFSSQAPQFYCKDLAKYKVDMIGEATKDCRARAEQIVKNAGGNLGNILSAKTGVFQITAEENADEVSDYGINDTSSINKVITAVVKCTFSIR